MLDKVCQTNKSEDGGWKLADLFCGSKRNFNKKDVEGESSKTRIDPSIEKEMIGENEPPEKKGKQVVTRNSYSYLKKAEILDKLFNEQAKDSNLSMSMFAESEEIDKAMISRWIKDQKNIFQKASDSKIGLLKKGRPSTKHQKTFQRLYPEFIELRKRGKKISFLWFWVKGKKIANEIGAPIFTKSAVEVFIKKYNLKVRRVQRKKQFDKTCYHQALQQWLLKFREGIIKSKSPDESHSNDPTWGRFFPHQRWNVDQVPLPFAIDMKTTYERPLDKNEKVWVGIPGSGLDKRQATLQLCTSPEGDLRAEIIFRGTGKRISKVEKQSYHKSVDVFWQSNAWADTAVSCEWVEKSLKPAIPQGEEFILLCDNLSAQVSDEFKQAVHDIKGIVIYGIPGENF